MELYRERFDKWLSRLDDGDALKDELLRAQGDDRLVEDMFYKELEFGTAGLRGVIGAGTNRMNALVVRRATLGLADYILSIDGAKERGVVIAYDSRRFSDAFARICAETLSGRGIRAYLFESLRAVPQLSFSLRRLNCIAGIMITASHNPANYNGYKVYWEDGGQLAPKQADEVLARINEHDYFEGCAAPDEGLITIVGGELDEAYYAATKTLCLNAELVKKKGSELKIVYTPLHGAGAKPVEAILRSIGITSLSVVEEQRCPDGSFPTVRVPNPEDRDAFRLAFKLAEKTGADVILATDPDSDRLGVAAKNNAGEFVLFTGNQIGCILLNYILSCKKANGTLKNNSLAAKSIVSTRLADAICARYGVRMVDVPTGFRFISEVIERCEKTHENEFLFGFEESYGFLAGGFSRDKDAICAAMLTAEACVYYRQQGKTLYDVLNDIFEEYGYYAETVKSYTCAGKEGMEHIASVMRLLRQAPPASIGGKRVTMMEDFKARTVKNFETGATGETELEPMDMVRLTLEDGAAVCVRPSGTEPKLKLYIGTRGSSRENASEGAEETIAFFDDMMKR